MRNRRFIEFTRVMTMNLYCRVKLKCGKLSARKLKIESFFNIHSGVLKGQKFIELRKNSIYTMTLQYKHFMFRPTLFIGVRRA